MGMVKGSKIVDADAFWRRVKIGGLDECWPWLGHGNVRGWEYGRVRYLGKRILTNRLAFQLSRNRPPVFNVLHTCDNPRCCNPVHLYDGTQAQNNLDTIVRERHKQAKLNPESVRLIRASSESDETLALKLGVNPVSIKYVRIGRTWKHVA